MTGNEAIEVLINAYNNVVKNTGRGNGKTALRTALLMGANAISILQQSMDDDDYLTAEDIVALRELLKKEV